MSRRCARLPGGGFMCGDFTKADVEQLESPHDQLSIADAIDEALATFDEIAAGGAS